MTVPGQGQEPNPQAGQEPGGSTPDAPPQTPPVASQEPVAREPERYDADYVKELRKSEAATRKRLQDAETRLKAVDDEKLSESERLQKLTAAEARATDLALQLVVERTAGKLGFYDPDDAYRLIDRKAVEMDDDGTPSNVDSLLQALVKSKPHLVKVEGEPKPAAQKGTPPTPKPSAEAPSPVERVKTYEKRLAGSGRYAPL